MLVGGIRTEPPKVMDFFESVNALSGIRTYDIRVMSTLVEVSWFTNASLRRALKYSKYCIFAESCLCSVLFHPPWIRIPLSAESLLEFPSSNLTVLAAILWIL